MFLFFIETMHVIQYKYNLQKYVIVRTPWPRGDGTSVITWIMVSWLHSCSVLGILWYASPIILQSPVAVRIDTMCEPDRGKYMTMVSGGVPPMSVIRPWHNICPDRTSPFYSMLLKLSYFFFNFLLLICFIYFLFYIINLFIYKHDLLCFGWLICFRVKSLLSYMDMFLYNGQIVDLSHLNTNFWKLVQ